MKDFKDRYSKLGKKDIGDVVSSRDVSELSQWAAFVPGVGGTAAEAVGMVTGTMADSNDTGRGIDALANRMGINKGQLMMESKLLRQDARAFEEGSALGKRGAKLGVDLAGAGAGALVGGALLPGFGVGAGAIVGGIAGRMGGGMVGGFVFPDEATSTTQLACEMCDKQDHGVEVTAEDVLRLVARKGSEREIQMVEASVAKGNRDGFGLGYITDSYLAPLLGDDFSPDQCTSCQYIADKINSGQIDAAQLVRCDAYMCAVPPQRQSIDGQETAVALDESYDGSSPTRPSSQIPDKGRGTKKTV